MPRITFVFAEKSPPEGRPSVDSDVIPRVGDEVAYPGTETAYPVARIRIDYSEDGSVEVFAYIGGDHHVGVSELGGRRD